MRDRQRGRAQAQGAAGGLNVLPSSRGGALTSNLVRWPPSAPCREELRPPAPPHPRSAFSTSRISRAGTSAPRAQLSRGAMIPVGSKPSFSSTRPEAGLSRKCEPSIRCSPSARAMAISARARLGRDASAPEGPREPIAELDRARRPAAEAARADQLRRAAAKLEDQAARAGPGRAGWQETPRRRACGRATEHWPGCGRSPRRQSRRQAPARPPGSPASAAILASSRTSSFSLASR